MKNLFYQRGPDVVIEVWDYVAGCKRDCWIDAVDLAAAATLKGAWYANPARKSTSKWYVNGKIYDSATKKCKTVMLHRLLLGVSDESTEVHHKDNDGLNNRRSNLEPVGHRRNMRERFPNKDWAAHDARIDLRNVRAKRNAAFRSVRESTGYSRQTIWSVYNGRTINSQLLEQLNAALVGSVPPTPTKHKRR